MATSVRSRSSFRVGRVKGYRRGSVWYLCYQEEGQRRRPRVGDSVEQAKLIAAQTNAQLHSGVATAPSFEPVTIAELRTRWLDYHELVRRSSVPTIHRYRTATDHLLNFISHSRTNAQAGNFTVTQAEAFVRYLRHLEVAPNGHRNTAKRRLRDKGVCFVLETCRSLFVFAAKRRHLPPYAENPFAALEIGRIPVEDAKPIILLTAQQERALLEACDDWQLPLFLTLITTGLRPGELAHLLLPGDVDLSRGRGTAGELARAYPPATPH